MRNPAVAGGPALQRCRDGVRGLFGWRRVALAFAAGCASVVAFAPFHAFPVLFITLPVLVWLIDGARGPRNAAVAGWCYGFGYFLCNLFWIGEAFLVEAEKFAWLLPFAVTLLPAGIAFFWAGASALCRRFWPEGWMRVIVLAAVLAAAEWLRGHVLTGLPWNVLGYALTYPLPLMQSAALFGVYALSIPAVLIFTLPLVLLADAPMLSPIRVLGAMLVALAPLLALAGFGIWRLDANPRRDVAGVRLRIVQPSVPQREKWQPDKQREIFEQHLEMSATGADGARDGLKGVTHVIWPEAAMPFLPLEHPEALQAIGALLPPGTSLISGALRREVMDGRQKGYNSIMAFDDTGRLVATYDKIHLVPFGEYLPFEPAMAALGLSKLTRGLGSFDTGLPPRKPIDVPGLPPVGGLICYEVLFPGAVIDDGRRPQALINVTNDGWFGDTSGPRQHFHQARVRAVEEGLPIIRAANNGISAVIDPLGRIAGIAGMNVKAVIDSPLPQALGPTAYGVARGWLLGVMELLSVLMYASKRG
ncbi:MAG TPA: apolipoprotein N-acyltransferase [Hyphomicrobium sp.]|nr:apolipoprotein N-acyltransferase [Hyphomicrobium sp.]